MANQYYNLNWSKYQKDICDGLTRLQQNDEFVDMTIAAQGHFVKVHKTVVAIASSYLKHVIKLTPCKHPVIFLDMTHDILLFILEYIYTGNVNVPVNKLNLFMQKADFLGIHGIGKQFDAPSTKKRPPVFISIPDQNPVQVKEPCLKRVQGQNNCVNDNPSSADSIFLVDIQPETTNKPLDTVLLDNQHQTNIEPVDIHLKDIQHETNIHQIDTHLEDIKPEINTGQMGTETLSLCSNVVIENLDFEHANDNLDCTNANKSINNMPVQIEINNFDKQFTLGLHTEMDINNDNEQASDMKMGLEPNKNFDDLTSFLIPKSKKKDRKRKRIDYYEGDSSDNENTSNQEPNHELNNVIPHIQVNSEEKSVMSVELPSSKVTESFIQFTVSNQGSLQLIMNRYIYYTHYKSNGGINRRWRCVDYRKKKCNALIDMVDGKITNRENPHDHTFHDEIILKKANLGRVFSSLETAITFAAKANNVQPSKLDK